MTVICIFFFVSPVWFYEPLIKCLGKYAVLWYHLCHSRKHAFWFEGKIKQEMSHVHQHLDVLLVLQCQVHNWSRLSFVLFLMHVAAAVLQNMHRKIRCCRIFSPFLSAAVVLSLSILKRNCNCCVELVKKPLSRAWHPSMTFVMSGHLPF